ncbi:MAG: inosose dehydratase, partial [bacterium]|nr:inosose dehydratase [bacterium]
MNLLSRTATAPISWGVCEMPGWGYQLPVEAVLAEMSEAGFTHTELGSLGYLPTDPHEVRAVLGRHGLSLLGGFVPLVLHDPSKTEDTLASASEAAALISGGGGQFFVSCAVSHLDDW